MIKHLFILVVCVFSSQILAAQQLGLSGDIRCKGPDKKSIGLSNVVIEPTFAPNRATVTASQPAGYFLIKTQKDAKQLIDKEITLYVIPPCDHCKEVAVRTYIWKEKLKTTDEGELLCILDPVYLKLNCETVTMNPRSADSMVKGFTNFMISRENEKNAKDGAYVASPALLQILSFLSLAAFAGPKPDTVHPEYYKLEYLNGGKMKAGQFLWNSAMSVSGTLGNNFSPIRDYTEAAFWNPSSIGLQYNSTNISTFINWTNHFKIAGFSKLGNSIFVSGGLLYNTQRENMDMHFVNVDDPTSTKDVSSTVKLRETALFIAPIVKLNNHFSVAGTFKPMWQNIIMPTQFETTAHDTTYNYAKVMNQKIDVDLSATYDFKNVLQAGINLMNVFNSRMFSKITTSDSLVADLPSRAAGFGLSYRRKHFNVGTDLLWTQTRIDASIGANYVFLRHCMVNLGYSPTKASFSLGFAYNSFKIAYVYAPANIVSTTFLHSLYSSFSLNF